MRLRAVSVLAVAVSLMAVRVAGAQEGLPPTLRVLTAADEMPEMFSFDPSTPPGLERELIEGFCRMHGLQFESVAVHNFGQIISMLERGEGDLITGIVATRARRARIDFTSEVYPMRHVIVTRQPNEPVTDPSDLRSLRVGVIPGTTWEDVVIEAGVPDHLRVAFADAGELFAGLREGTVDAVVVAIFDFALAQKRDAALSAGAFVGPRGYAAFGVRKADTRLLDALNTYLEATRQSRHHLMFRYLTEDALSLIALARRE
jgi:ABC-type amino acid transport substrate-binding protein